MEKHTPNDHKNHDANEPCGCWTGDGEAIVCMSCGAAYKKESVKRFPRWHCYDCEGLVYAQAVGMPELP